MENQYSCGREHCQYCYLLNKLDARIGNLEERLGFMLGDHLDKGTLVPKKPLPSWAKIPDSCTEGGI